jgi:hypothetical protein
MPIFFLNWKKKCIGEGTTTTTIRIMVAIRTTTTTIKEEEVAEVIYISIRLTEFFLGRGGYKGNKGGGNHHQNNNGSRF